MIGKTNAVNSGLAIYKALIDVGVTPTGKDTESLVNAIKKLATVNITVSASSSLYNELSSDPTRINSSLDYLNISVNGKNYNWSNSTSSKSDGEGGTWYHRASSHTTSISYKR